MSKKTEALEVILGLMPNAKFIDKNGKDVTEDVKKSHNVANNIAQRNSQDEELMKKIFPHKEIIEGESVLVFPYIEEATPLKDVPQEVVSHMEKTIDHISQEGKKVSLTELWKKGELEQGYYYTRYTPSVGKPFVEIELRSYLIDLAKIRDTETVEVLAPVPSWEEYLESESHCAVYSEVNKGLKEKLEPFTDPYFKGLTTKHISELAKKSIRLTKQSCEDNTTIQRLKELLGYCADILEELDDKDRDIEILLEEVNEVLA